MLIDFKVNNFKIFKNETVFTMVADSNINNQEYSIFKESIDDLNIKGLSTALIYGPTGVGKSSLIQSIELLQKIILDGTLKPITDTSSIPNLNLSERRDLEFKISFIDNKTFFTYLLKVNVGSFTQKSKPEITYERMVVNEKTIFERMDNKVIYLNEAFLNNKESEKSSTTDRNFKKLQPDRLFLSDSAELFKDEIIETFISWFKSKLIFLNNPVKYIPDQVNFETDEDIVNSMLNSTFPNQKPLKYIPDKESGQLKLVSIIDQKNFENPTFIEAEKFESSGKIKLFNLLLNIIHAFRTGATVFVDEIDASLHITLIMTIIKFFHDDRINVKHAQLILVTNNPIYMKPRYVRKDEVYFLNFNDENGVELYSLVDFEDLEENENYSESYLEGQYLALLDTDLSNILIEHLDKVFPKNKF